jgi:1-acyl-sn-glycerol-3-phosphate acyltransferase
MEAQTLASVRQLLAELGALRGLEELSARGAAAHLERELGLGSLERVELMVRLGHATGTRLPDRVMAEAETVQDLVNALVGENIPADAGRTAHGTTATSSPQTGGPSNAELEEKIRSAESLTEILRLRGVAEPGRAHIHLYGEDDRLQTISFGELYSRASSVARELRRRGLEPGQTVAIMLPTCAEFFYTFGGILLAGGIPVPIYPPFRANRIAEYAARQSNILRNAESRFLVTFKQAEGLARLLQPSVPSLREVLNAERLAMATDEKAAEPAGKWRPVEFLAHHARGQDIAFLQYTSGSTGDPKGVTLTHANLLANIRSIMAGVEVGRDDVAVSWLPLYHDMGLIGAWFVPLVAGVSLVVMSPLAFLSRPVRWLKAIHTHRGTVSPAPNFAYELCERKIADAELEGLDLSSWRSAFNGAEPVQPETMERFANRFEKHGFRRGALLPVYGLAEATLGVSAAKFGEYRVDRVDRAKFESEGYAMAATGDTSALEFVSAGKPLPGVEVRVVGSDGADAGERREGRLWLRSASATSGYYRNPAATKELIREPGWLDSGDLAYLADGEIHITGRAKDLIIKAGRNLYPQEIEEVAGRVAGVRTGCVVAFGAPDRASGTERLVVAAEVRDLTDTGRISAEITRAVSEAMGVPPDVVELIPSQSIPKTSSGKLRRRETRQLYLDGKLGRKAAPAWMQIGKLALRAAGPRIWSIIRHGVICAVEMVYGVYALAAFTAIAIPLWLGMSVIWNRKWAARLLRAGMRSMLFVAGIPVHVEGRELLAEAARSGPWIFASNHSSYVDILATVALLPANVRFVVKGEVLEMPFFGTMTRRSGQFTFDRSDPAARVQQAEQVDAALKRGEPVAIYPEGTFTAETGVRPFQLGAFKAAVDSGRPICPVAVRGARRILRDGTFLPRPGSVTVTLGPLVAPNPGPADDWREIVRLRDATREIIARNSGEPMI